MLNFRKNLIYLLFFVNFFYSAPISAGMTSTNYRIISDDLAPGALSSSTNYATLGAIGEWQGVSTSTNYSSLGGFPGSQPDTTLSISLSGTNISFGSLEKGTVSSISRTATVSTDAPGGYTLRISENSNLAAGGTDIDDVSDGSVTAGSEEYGIKTSGDSGLFNATDTAITSSWKNIASATSPVTSQATVISFKVAVNGGTEPGSYSHTVTIAAVASY